MTTILDHYKILGVSVGAGINDVTSSYKRLCRLYHPDVNNDPESEELMKRINIAYTVLRDKLKREAAFREYMAYSRSTRRYASQEARTGGAEAGKAETSRTETSRAETESEKEAYSVIHSYFKALSSFDYSEAYDCLSLYDKRHISRASFLEWRTSVARLFPMREFKVGERSAPATVTFNDDKVLQARKFYVKVTEEDLKDNTQNAGDVEKLVIRENGVWKVFLGYRNVHELTRTFDERFEAGRKQDVAKSFGEYYNGLYPEYNMFSAAGMRKAALREIYRQKRFGGNLTFAAISVSVSGGREAGLDELLRSTARTINRTLRETDIPAYVGDGVFAILFVELKKKNAEYIVDRLAKKIRGGAGAQLGERADIEYAFESWPASSYADIGAMNKVLGSFAKNYKDLM